MCTSGACYCRTTRQCWMLNAVNKEKGVVLNVVVNVSTDWLTHWMIVNFWKQPERLNAENINEFCSRWKLQWNGKIVIIIRHSADFFFSLAVNDALVRGPKEGMIFGRNGKRDMISWDAMRCISCLCGWRRSSKWQINVNILRSAVHMCATTDPIPINVEYINRQCRKRDRKTDNNMFCGNNHRCWLAACIGMSMVGAVASTIGLLRLCDCYATSHSRNESKWNGMDNFKY